MHTCTVLGTNESFSFNVHLCFGVVILDKLYNILIKLSLVLQFVSGAYSANFSK